MKAALFLDLPRPATGSFVFLVLHRTRTRPTADAGVTPIVQRIVRHFVFEHEGPNVFFGPTQQRIDFDETELRVPLHQTSGGAVGRLVAADSADPGLVTGNGAAQRQDFPVVTALIGPMRIERAAVFSFIFCHRQLGTNQLYLNTVALLDPLAKFQRFGKLVAGFEVEHAHSRLDLGQHVNDAAPLGAERSGHRQSGMKLVNCPSQDCLWRQSFKALDWLRRFQSVATSWRSRNLRGPKKGGRHRCRNGPKGASHSGACPLFFSKGINSLLI